MFDIVELYFKIKNAIKKVPLTIKDFFEEFDFFGFINKILNNKKILKIIIFLTIFIIILAGLLLFNNYMKRLEGPNVKNLKIMESPYGEITYSGDIQNGYIVGKGLLTIIGDEWAIEYDGNFEYIEDYNNDLDINIGKFVSGKISIINRTSGNKYIYNGTFKDNNLDTGYIEKQINGTTVKYSGSFIENKLNGTGTKYMNVNGTSKTIEGFFRDGILKN